MKPSVRVLSMALGALAVLALGFVVSVAANSVPGRGADEPFLDSSWRPGIDGTTILTWLVLIAAVMGVIIMALSTREARPSREAKRHGILVLILGVIVFALVARYMRSISDTLLPETSELIGEVGEAPIADSSGNGAWLLSLMVAAVIAVALTRVGLAIRSAAPPFQDLAQDEDRSPREVATPDVAPLVVGVDPRARILSAYGGFERRVGEAGVPRGPTETAAHHAARAGIALGLAGEDLTLLSGRHADARFGPDAPSIADAGEAESAAARLQDEVR